MTNKITPQEALDRVREYIETCYGNERVLLLIPIIEGAIKENQELISRSEKMVMTYAKKLINDAKNEGKINP